MGRLEEKGYEAYIVGGSVRDILLGKEPTDYDITTDALPDEIEFIFSDLKTINIGKEYGTIIICQKEGIQRLLHLGRMVDIQMAEGLNGYVFPLTF